MAAEHHGKAKRSKRSRDGVSWDPTGGAGVSKKQKKGYSGSDGKKIVTKGT